MIVYSSVQYTTSGSLPYILLFTQALTRVGFDVTIIDINTTYPLYSIIVVMLGYDWGLRMVMINITCLKYQEVVLYLQPLNTLALYSVLVVYYLPKPLFVYVLMVLLSIVGLYS